MAYFANINNLNIVIEVIAIANDVLGEPENTYPATEPIGQDFIANTLQLPGTWLQTSYNGNFRGTFAGIQYTYDAQKDIFVAPVIANPDLPPLIEDK